MIVSVRDELQRIKLEKNISLTAAMFLLANDFGIGYSTVFRYSRKDNSAYLLTLESGERLLARGIKREICSG